MRLRVPSFVILTVLSNPAGAVQDPAQLCDQATNRAARMAGVPLDILLAISRVETGRDLGQGLAPWPWTINVAGEGAYFDDLSLAVVEATQIRDAGAENFDVGCFQLNYRWHGGAFPSLEAMFDPDTNALYAANFLLTLYESSGNWPQAVGAYHSRSQDRADGYLARVDALLGGGLATAPGQSDLRLAEAATTEILRENNFPLLRSGATGQGGSLVPTTLSRGSLFAANN